MAHQHRFGNWKTEDNKLVRDARAMRNMLVESNSSSSSFSNGFNNLNSRGSETTDHLINHRHPHQYRGNTNTMTIYGVSSILVIDNMSFSSLYPTIGAQSGAGPTAARAEPTSLIIISNMRCSRFSSSLSSNSWI